MDNEKLFQFMEKMYGEMQQGFKEVKGDIKELKDGQKKIEITIENDVKPKIEALFDGYKQNTEQLNRIEEKVNKDEEIILKRIK